jgi:hypothetical protein
MSPVEPPVQAPQSSENVAVSGSVPLGPASPPRPNELLHGKRDEHFLSATALGWPLA